MVVVIIAWVTWINDSDGPGVDEIWVQFTYLGPDASDAYYHSTGESSAREVVTMY